MLPRSTWCRHPEHGLKWTAARCRIPEVGRPTPSGTGYYRVLGGGNSTPGSVAEMLGMRGPQAPGVEHGLTYMKKQYLRKEQPGTQKEF